MLAVAQTAIAMLIRGRVSRWLQRPAPWAAVVRFGSMAMTVYLWHLSLLVIAFLALFGLGIDPPVAGSGLWWLTRPFWLLGPAPHGSSILLFVPVDPIQNTVCVLVGFALSTFAARWSRQSA